MKQTHKVDVPHYTDSTKRQKQEWKIFNDNNDMVTSCHSYWGRDSIPNMLEEINDQLSKSENMTEKLDLMIYKKNLEQMLEISVRLGERPMSYHDENGNAEIVSTVVYNK